MQTPREYVLGVIPERTVGIEIGVHEGDFSAAILRQSDPYRLHLIDPWKHETDDVYQNSWYGGHGTGGQSMMDARYKKVQERFKTEIDTGQVVLHRCFSDEVVGTFDDASVDWVYIDGNHMYEYVRKDLELYYPKVKPGGFLMGDDYGVEGWWRNGVQKAVDEFASKHSEIMLEIRESQFVFKKKIS